MSPPPSETSTASRRRDLLQILATGTAGVVGEAFCRALVHQLSEVFEADLVFLAECFDDPPGRAVVMAAWSPGGLMEEGHEFTIDNTMPCSLTIRDGVAVMPEGVAGRYPGDEMVVRNRLDAYVGLGLPGADGSQVGYLAVMSRGRLNPDPDEVAVLQIFAARAGAEIERRRHLAALRARDAEVAAARSRMVQAADEERRRIGRDLHDGAQQRVVALGHLIGIARRRLGEEAPAPAVELLDRAVDEARMATEELRELARGLHPAGLVEKGLGPTLEALAQRSAIPVTLGPLPERRLPPPVELTAYYLSAEGVTNAGRYARATSVTIDVRQTADLVTIVIADDGVGGADAEAGSGLRGLGDRVAALGGVLTITSPLGEGTRMEARIPLAPWRSAREPFLEFGHSGDVESGLASIAEVLEGRKRATIGLAREWELEGGLPRIGQLLPVLDAAGNRHGTVEVQRASMLPFSEIDEAILADTGAGEESVESWRQAYQRFYDACRDEIALILGQPGWRLTPEEPMAVVWFRLAEDPAGTLPAQP